MPICPPIPVSGTKEEVRQLAAWSSASEVDLCRTVSTTGLIDVSPSSEMESDLKSGPLTEALWYHHEIWFESKIDAAIGPR